MVSGNTNAAVSVVVVLANFLSVLQLAICSLLSTPPYFYNSFLYLKQFSLSLSIYSSSSLGLLSCISCQGDAGTGSFQLFNHHWFRYQSRKMLPLVRTDRTASSWNSLSWLDKGGRDTRLLFFVAILLHKQGEDRPYTPQKCYLLEYRASYYLF